MVEKYEDVPYWQGKGEKKILKRKKNNNEENEHSKFLTWEISVVSSNNTMK